MLLEEADRLLVRGIAGHDVIGDGHAGPPRTGDRLFDEKLKQRIIANGADGKHALGMVKPQSASLSAGDQNDANLAVSQQLLALPGRFPVFGYFLRRIGQSDQIARPCGAPRAGFRLFSSRCCAGFRQETFDLREINGGDLCNKCFAFRWIEFIPRVQQMLLVVLLEWLDEFRGM